MGQPWNHENKLQTYISNHPQDQFNIIRWKVASVE